MVCFLNSNLLCYLAFDLSVLVACNSQKWFSNLYCIVERFYNSASALCATEMQVICEYMLHVRQNPPLLKICAQMIGFFNSLCYAEGLSFTFYTQYIAQVK